jgi:radical SAM protein with 4Fe4S-binding SPASM domain
VLRQARDQATLTVMAERPKRYALAIELTSYCNQKCGYCYNGWREDGGKSVGSLATPELVALVDRALTEVDFDHVTLTGGEPFARRDVFDVLETVKEHGKRAKIISNGGVITDALAERLAPYRPYYVQVTLNAPSAALHDEHVGGEHWDATMNGIAALRRAGVPISGCVVVTRKNAHLVGEILDLWRSLGVTNIALSRFSPAGYAAQHVAELLCSRSELIVALDAAQARTPEMHVSVTMPVPQCTVEHASYPGIHFGGCPIGTEAQELALGPRGELRNCTLHEEVIGDAKTTSFAELVTSDAVMHYRDVTPEFCAPCPFKSSCLGGCGAASQWTLGKRGLDPFVAQHVDDGFRRELAKRRSLAVVQ